MNKHEPITRDILEKVVSRHDEIMQHTSDRMTKLHNRIAYLESSVHSLKLRTGSVTGHQTKPNYQESKQIEPLLISLNSLIDDE